MEKSSKLIPNGIPLFPTFWIWREIGYHEPYTPEFRTLWKDFPDLRKSKPILKRLSKQGADPNYLATILYYHSDPSKEFEFWKVIREGSPVDLPYNEGKYHRVISEEEFLKGKEALSKIQLLVPEVEKIVGTDIVNGLKDSMSKIKEFLQHFDQPGVFYYTLPIPTRPKKPKRGRPPKENFNKMVCLLYRHLKKQVEFLPGHKGVYSIIAEILRAASNDESVEKKNMMNIVQNCLNNKDMDLHCKVFEKKFMGIGKRFIKRAKKKKTYELVRREWE